jgi:hypothetical protein
LILVVVVPFRTIHFLVYAMGVAFLPVLVAPLQPSFWNHAEWSVVVREFHLHPGNDTMIAAV